jgi:hypothetical protein
MCGGTTRTHTPPVFEEEADAAAQYLRAHRLDELLAGNDLVLPLLDAGQPPEGASTRRSVRALRLVSMDDPGFVYNTSSEYKREA